MTISYLIFLEVVVIFNNINLKFSINWKENETLFVNCLLELTHSRKKLTPPPYSGMINWKISAKGYRNRNRIGIK